MRFKCSNCGEEFNVSVKPAFCPLCGSDSPDKNITEYMQGQIKRLEKLNHEMSKYYDKIAPLKIEADRISATLRTYKSRGLSGYRTKTPTLKDSIDKLKNV